MSFIRARFVLGTACAPALVVAGVALTEPALHPGSSAPGPGEVVGVLHVHTVASDGAGTVDGVLRAARAGGLDFVLLTDHNRWGAPEWTYRDSVLLIVGEEVNTPHGHLLVAGRRPVGDRRRRGAGDAQAETDAPGRPGPEAADEPGTEARGADDAPRPAVGPREGLRIAAHPTGRTPWTGWEGREFDGIEIWNADTERRDDGAAEWIRAVALLPVGRMSALYRLLDHPEEELALWDRLLAERPVFGVCSVDAHHTLPLNSSGSLDLHFPAYRHSFAMARQHVLLPAGRTGEAAAGGRTGEAVADGRAILAALARGRSYCAFDGLADARGARFVVTSGRVSGTLGDSVAWRPGARVEVTLPETASQEMGLELRLVRDGRVAERRHGPEPGTMELPGPGVYRLEVRMERGGAPVPWILTNPLWVVEGAAAGDAG